jgi:hypothetical protein
MAIVQKACDGNQPLSYLQTVVQQEEGIYGPLSGLMAQAPNNVMTLQIGASPAVGKRAVLEVYSGHPPQKDGHVLICVANCLVNAAMQSVAAYRPT